MGEDSLDDSEDRISGDTVSLLAASLFTFAVIWGSGRSASNKREECVLITDPEDKVFWWPVGFRFDVDAVFLFIINGYCELVLLLLKYC